MFGQSNFKQEVSQVVRQLEQRISNLEMQQNELKAQNQRLSKTLKSVARKLVMRLPISLESLDKNLNYDLIFPDEVESWLSISRDGIVLDVRNTEEFLSETVSGAISMPSDQVASRIERFDRHTPLLVVCENGVRSVSVCEQLSAKGFHFLYVLKGGMSQFQGLRAPGAPRDFDAAAPVAAESSL